jgi:hypothetical protein
MWGSGVVGGQLGSSMRHCSSTGKGLVVGVTVQPNSACVRTRMGWLECVRVCTRGCLEAGVRVQVCVWVPRGGGSPLGCVDGNHFEMLACLFRTQRHPICLLLCVRVCLQAGVADLDAWLNPSQRAEVLAFVTLLSAKLDVATHYTMWLEARGFGEFRKVRACVLGGGTKGGPHLVLQLQIVGYVTHGIAYTLFMHCGSPVSPTFSSSYNLFAFASHPPPPAAPRPRVQAAYDSVLPFPLSYIVPWSQRSEMRRLLGHIDGFKVRGRGGGGCRHEIGVGRVVCGARMSWCERAARRNACWYISTDSR